MLKLMKHQRAGEFEEEAQHYKEDFVEAFREKVKGMHTWMDAKGREHPFVPSALSGDNKEGSRHPFYGDCGSQFLVFAGLMSAEDPAMESVLAWFREGPAHQSYNRDADWNQVPVLDHEMSSSEPCYSWNMFHNLELGDRIRFMEGMYSLFAGSLSQQTRISCETRGGITGTVFSASMAIYLARLSVLDDESHDNELHLLRLVPLAWLQKDKELIMENMPTIYGPVTLRGKLSEDGSALNLEYKADFRVEPSRVVLHQPPLEGLREIYLNGERMQFEDEQCELNSSCAL